jgi:hypothetical protein
LIEELRIRQKDAQKVPNKAVSNDLERKKLIVDYTIKIRFCNISNIL